MSLIDVALFYGPPLAVIAAVVFAIVAPKLSARAAESYVAAKVSPAWFALAPLVVLIFVVYFRRDYASRAAITGTLATQTLIGTCLVARHRRWPWAALAVVVTAIIYSVGLSFMAVLAGGPPH